MLFLQMLLLLDNKSALSLENKSGELFAAGYLFFPFTSLDCCVRPLLKN